ncbi:MAG: (d)CMP kinase [Minwuia sp.]|nr:(d)CMP kinase [Minwuia sp.]
MKPVIAVDGPTASGKGTLARRLAAELGFAYLDTGGLYRATALRLIRSGSDGEDVTAAVAAAGGITATDLKDPGLREEATGNMASKVAALQPVRDALFAFQQAFAADPPGDAPGAVLDGRDIGTVVCPKATAKLFITATTAARGARRHAELLARGEDIALETVLEDLRARDHRDSHRAAAPLKPAADADLLDTTELDIEAAFFAARKLVTARLARQA